MNGKVDDLESRAEQIDILKAICAFLIICIHIPFPGVVGSYFTTLTRIAVPIFFMITGYFYSDTVARHREINQLKKLFKLIVEANALFLIWRILYELISRKHIMVYLQSVITVKNVIKFLIFNESPVGYHLWYLGAILYVLLIVLFADKLKCRKVLYWLTPILIVGNLVLGKYSFVIFHRAFPYILVRNFLCVGIPYFCIGTVIRNKKTVEHTNKKLCILIVLSALTSIGERIILVSTDLNITRDHYVSTTFLAIVVFVYALKSNWGNTILARIGRYYSTWLYIIHPIFITVLGVVFRKIGLYSVYSYVAPIIVYLVSLVFLVILRKMKVQFMREINFWKKVTQSQL